MPKAKSSRYFRKQLDDRPPGWLLVVAMFREFHSQLPYQLQCTTQEVGSIEANHLITTIASFTSVRIPSSAKNRIRFFTHALHIAFHRTHFAIRKHRDVTASPEISWRLDYAKVRLGSRVMARAWAASIRRWSHRLWSRILNNAVNNFSHAFLSPMRSSTRNAHGSRALWGDLFRVDLGERSDVEETRVFGG